MSALLADIRTRVREDLQDTGDSNYRWTNDEIDGAIERAIREYSLACPLKQKTDVATVDGSHELDISGLANRLKVYSIEFPKGEYPPFLQSFELYMDTAYMEAEGNGDDVAVRWGELHTLSTTETTIPVEHEETVVLGATAYLATSAAAYTADRATISGRWAAPAFLRWGAARLGLYHSRLKDLTRNIKTGSLEGGETTRVLPQDRDS